MNLSIQSNVNQVLSIAQMIALKRRQAVEHAERVETRANAKAKKEATKSSTSNTPPASSEGNPNQSPTAPKDTKTPESAKAETELKKVQTQKRNSRKNLSYILSPNIEESKMIRLPHKEMM